MADNQEKLLKLIEEAKPEVVVNDANKLFTYVDIPEKKLKRLSTFDEDLNLNDFVALYDTSLFNSATSGLLFTLYGFYFEDAFTKKYFNYKDIQSLTIELTGKKKDSKVLIIKGESESAQISSIFYNKEALKNLLDNIVSVSSKWVNDGVIITRTSGKIERKLNLTKDQIIKCNTIIHTASVAAGGVGTGLAQIPLADNIVIAPIQITMITSLGAVFGIRVTEGMAKGIISTLAAGFVGRSISQLLIGWVPLLGNAINTATAAGITEAIGWAAVKHFQYLKKQNEKKGRLIGLKEGIEKASLEYEDKFKNQVETFLKQQKIYENDRQEFITLIEEYEQFIVELELDPNNYTEEQKPILIELESKLGMLKKLEIEGENTDDTTSNQ
jgi:uncharacterized protein (DUF697 family)